MSRIAHVEKVANRAGSSEDARAAVAVALALSLSEHQIDVPKVDPEGR